MNKLVIEGNPKTNEEWYKIGTPKCGKKQWVPLYSAYELADYFLFYKDDVPEEINDYLENIGVNGVSFHAIPEQGTPLNGFGKGGARKHDLLMVSDKIIVGIEGKASEHLDKYVSEYKRDSDNKKKRYEGLCKALLNKDIKQCGNIRYQLLSATAGTLIEADDRHVDKAALIIVLFKSHRKATIDNIEVTKNDIKAFKAALKEYENYDEDGNRYFNIPFKPHINFYIDFEVVDVSSYSNRK